MSDTGEKKNLDKTIHDFSCNNEIDFLDTKEVRLTLPINIYNALCRYASCFVGLTPKKAASRIITGFLKWNHHQDSQ
jgi:hypothetical protein